MKEERVSIVDGSGPPPGFWETGDFFVGGGSQYTRSEGHLWRTKNRAPGDIGGEFLTSKTVNRTKRASNTHIVKVDYINNGYTKRTFTYDACLYAANPSQPSPPDLSSSDTALRAKGTTAVARCKPTNSVANLSTFLGELLVDRLPSIPVLRSLEKKASLALSLGEEFLNKEFGWDPFVADIKDIAKAITHAQAVIKQFERDAGRQVRRRYNFPTERSTESTLLGSTVFPYMGPSEWTDVQNSVGYGTQFRTREITRETWFSGAFMYHLPTGYFGSKADDIATKAHKLLGLDLTPSVIWELAPWSWAVDWVSNIGDGISNISDWTQYGLVMRYGYIMETTSVTDTYTLFTNGTYAPLARIEPVVIDTVVKKRLAANPYGFGVDWNGLNPLQLSILGALGITRH